ncbi:MAG: DUF3899 domain-containing protein [Clostridia bacterium]|nr:DUF3899 domain-containing protein [Clostridia bacterium]
MSGFKPQDSNAHLLWYIGSGVALVIAIVVSLIQGLGLGRSAQVNLRALSDGFFVAGVLVCGVGLLMLIDTTGFFDMLLYGLQGLWHRLTPFLHPKGQEAFYDFKTARASRRGKTRWELVLVGVGCFLIAGIFLIFYYM